MNGVAQDEPYLANEDWGELKETVVPQDMVFVMATTDESRQQSWRCEHRFPIGCAFCATGLSGTGRASRAAQASGVTAA